MKKLLKKKVNVFGKGIPVLAIFVLGIALVSAALLTVYGTITGFATVSQSVTIDDGAYSVKQKFSFDEIYLVGGFVAGQSFDDPVEEEWYVLKNNADVPATVKLVIDQQPRDNMETPREVKGIDTKIYGVLELTSKDGDWNPDERMKATLHYSVVGNEFGYELEATGLDSTTAYSLIYYADKPDRFVEWGGNNPGALIAEFTTDESGNIILTYGSIDLEMNLPHENDANVNTDETNYCDVDNFVHCAGAKIWLVPSIDYNVGEKKLIAWHQADYLYETDLIVYSDASDGTITLPAGGGVNFRISNDFALDLIPKSYTVTVEVIPAE